MTTVEYPRLAMRGIRKRFGPIEVLHGVDFEVRPGQVHALVGHNGAGKSTLMKVLGGVYPQYEGEVYVDGEEAGSNSPREAIERGVAIIYQDFALVPELDVAHNIALGREPSAGRMFVPHRALVKRSAAEAKRYGIALPLKTPVRQLGVAQQQLTEIVRALARDVKVLVMDEPTARLAPREREVLFGVVRQLARRGVGIVYISHFLDEVLEISDHVTVLRDGDVAETGPATSFTTTRLAQSLVGEEEELVELVRNTAEIDRTSTPRLEARALTMRGRPPVDLTVHAGEVVALAGLVGSGRTRIARSLVGDLRASGEVLLDGVRLPRSPVHCARRGVLLVPEDRKRNGLVLSGSMRANIELTGLGRQLSRFGLVLSRAVDKTVDAAIKRFGIRPADPRRQVGSLSGGNAQKVLVARAVSSGPRLVIFDQPTAGVDVGAKAELHREVLALAAGGAGVVMISDDLDETLQLADRVLTVVGGHVAGEYRAGELTRAGLLEAISVGAEVSA